MADVNRGNRPLSPHLQIYRLQIPMISSILARITGNALLVGALVFIWWLFAAAAGPEYYAFANGLVTSWLGLLVLAGSLWALYFHGLAGIRHLIWDSGHGLDLATSERMGWVVILGSVAATLVTLVALAAG
ncbi:MAG: succinate dehydrogenase, cytochrome b556 subunit [Rhodobacteraceae bacterium]|jgi:succinate dehydrogenase / fumarate reductase cytochrome b subunit|nr:succinate dehydrogenase, cytochrome b556 subunit [Paracoccaceae bacterium]